MKNIAESLRILIQERTQDVEELGKLVTKLYTEYALYSIISTVLILLLVVALGHALFSLYRYKMIYKNFKREAKLELRRFYGKY